MKQFISKITNEEQDKNCEAWDKLCLYIDELSQTGFDEFSPEQVLGPELYSQIHTLPETIGNLKDVKKISLYGSSLKRIPPEIGGMESLEYFDPYTSYELHWFPYEITKCSKLKDSRVSTRAVYGNYKYRNPFPSLYTNQVMYENDKYICGTCSKEMTHDITEQYWLTLQVGTDYLPLLVNVCSDECRDRLPTSDEGYVQYPHKGGSKLVQPNLDEMEYYQLRSKNKAIQNNSGSDKSDKPRLFKFIRKIWE